MKGIFYTNVSNLILFCISFDACVRHNLAQLVLKHILCIRNEKRIHLGLKLIEFFFLMSRCPHQLEQSLNFIFYKNVSMEKILILITLNDEEKST